MGEDLHAALQTVREQVLDPGALVRATAGGRRKGTTPRWQRVELRPVSVKAGPRLQVVTFDERQSFTSNQTWGEEAQSAVDSLLAEPFSHWHVITTLGEYAFRVTKAGRVLVQHSGRGAEQRTEHDRTKVRLVDPAEPFLRGLGVTSAEGVVKPSRRDKYQQVEQFVRALDAAVREARTAGRLARPRLRVADLGCGNAYLTFAAYRHLTGALGLSVELIGVDVKRQSREHNTAVAARLGWQDDVHFVEGEIGQVQLDQPIDQPIDIVMALHACDTATDEALARAVDWRAELILAAPCCHHDLQRQLKGAAAPGGFELVTRHGLLRERLADVLTDALRAHLLRRSGYRTDVMEFVESQHTPRNALLRAHWTGSAVTAEQEAQYRQLTEGWGLRPRLAELLEGKDGGQESEVRNRRQE